MKLKTHFAAAASALALLASAAMAKDTVTYATQLEPPHLDPTGGAAQAIDTVVYLNIFEGLTRFTPDGAVVSARSDAGLFHGAMTVWQLITAPRAAGAPVRMRQRALAHRRLRVHD